MTLFSAKVFLSRMVPRGWNFAYFLNPKDLFGTASFVITPGRMANLRSRWSLVARMYAISSAIACVHSENQIISFIKTVLSLPDKLPGDIVEAGCYRGGSTAKISIAASIVGRRLVVFDSFQGLPAHDERLRGARGGWHPAPAKSFASSLDEVRENVRRYGEPGVCDFVPGWFSDTLPEFSRPVSAIILDVTLASSTRTCVKHLYPLLSAGGVLYSCDGYSPLVCGVLLDDDFWRSEVGCARPAIKGLGTRKVIRIVKANDDLGDTSARTRSKSGSR